MNITPLKSPWRKHPYDRGPSAVGSKVIEQQGHKLSASKSRIPPPPPPTRQMGVCVNGVVTQNSVLPVLGVSSYSFRS